MEKLIFKERNGHFYIKGLSDQNAQEMVSRVIYKLMKYEQSDLTPEEVMQLKKQAHATQIPDIVFKFGAPNTTEFFEKHKGKKLIDALIEVSND